MIWCYFTTQCFTNDTMPKKFCTSESLYNVHQWSRIIPIQLSVHQSSPCRRSPYLTLNCLHLIFSFLLLFDTGVLFLWKIYHVELTFMSLYTCIHNSFLHFNSRIVLWPWGIQQAFFFFFYKSLYKCTGHTIAV